MTETLANIKPKWFKKKGSKLIIALRVISFSVCSINEKDRIGIISNHRYTNNSSSYFWLTMKSVEDIDYMIY